MPIVDTGAPKISGIPLSEPNLDMNAARTALQRMQSQYPGQIFFLESTGEQGESGMVVSWIPSWYIQRFFDGLLFSTLLGAAPSQKPW